MSMSDVKANMNLDEISAILASVLAYLVVATGVFACLKIREGCSGNRCTQTRHVLAAALFPLFVVGLCFQMAYESLIT